MSEVNEVERELCKKIVSAKTVDDISDTLSELIAYRQAIRMDIAGEIVDILRKCVDHEKGAINYPDAIKKIQELNKQEEA